MLNAVFLVHGSREGLRFLALLVADARSFEVACRWQGEADVCGVNTSAGAWRGALGAGGERHKHELEAVGSVHLSWPSRQV